MNKEQLVKLILESKEIILCQPTTGEFPNHDWVEQSLNDFVYVPNKKTLFLYHNPGYEV